MPITSAARRASRASSSVQQPRAPVRSDAGALAKAKCTPVTSCPASTARAAATAESTPPDMAARTLTAVWTCSRGPHGGGWRRRTDPTGALDHGADGLDQRVHVGRGGAVAKGEPQRGPSPVVRSAYGEQHVAGPRHPGRAGRPGGALDPASVEQ